MEPTVIKRKGAFAMWHIDKNGAFSIVKKHCEPDELLVRGRVHDDMKRLAGKLNIPESVIIETPTADYRYRMTVKASAFAEYLAATAFAIDYRNFKTSLPFETQLDKKRALAYSAVWSALYKLQQE
jgi:hypothetical protein